MVAMRGEAAEYSFCRRMWLFCATMRGEFSPSGCGRPGANARVVAEISRSRQALGAVVPRQEVRGVRCGTSNFAEGGAMHLGAGEIARVGACAFP